MANIVDYYSNCERMCRNCDKLLRVEKRERSEDGELLITVTCYRYYNRTMYGDRDRCDNYDRAPERKM